MQSNYLKGAAFGVAAASIWAGWSAVTRLAVTTSLDAWDIAALRFGVAGLLLAPIMFWRGLARDRLGRPGLGVIVTGLGAPYVLVAAAGLCFAPASDQGALNPGCMPLFVALIGAVVIGDRLATTRKLRLALILAGALVIVGWHVEDWSTGWTASRSFGDALFLCASFLTACFTVVMSRAKLDPVHAASLVATGSLVIYLPVYLALFGTRLARLSVPDLSIQAIFQGILRHDRLRCSVRSCGRHPWRFQRRGLRRSGAGAVGTVCHPAARRMAKPNRLAGHRADLRRRLPGERPHVAS